MTSSWCISSSMLKSKSLPTFEFKCIRLKRSAIAASKGHPGTSSLPEVLPLAMAWEKWFNIFNPKETGASGSIRTSREANSKATSASAFGTLSCDVLTLVVFQAQKKDANRIISYYPDLPIIRYHPYRRIRILSILSFLVLNCFIFWPYTDT